MKYLFLPLVLVLGLINCTTRENSSAHIQTLSPKPGATVDVAVDESRVLFGSAKGTVTIVKYADFQCPACSMDVASVEEIKKKYGDQVRFIHKAIPLEHIHPQARLAAQVFEALLIKDKEKAQKFYSVAYQQARGWGSDQDIWKIVKAIGGSETQIQNEIKKGEIDARIESDLREHQALGFRGTPAYMINGLSLYGAQSFSNLSQAVVAALKK